MVQSGGGRLDPTETIRRNDRLPIDVRFDVTAKNIAVLQLVRQFCGFDAIDLCGWTMRLDALNVPRFRRIPQ
jgi:hypothetical protein